MNTYVTCIRLLFVFVQVNVPQIRFLTAVPTVVTVSLIYFSYWCAVLHSVTCISTCLCSVCLSRSVSATVSSWCPAIKTDEHCVLLTCRYVLDHHSFRFCRVHFGGEACLCTDLCVCAETWLWIVNLRDSFESRLLLLRYMLLFVVDSKLISFIFSRMTFMSLLAT